MNIKILVEATLMKLFCRLQILRKLLFLLQKLMKDAAQVAISADKHAHKLLMIILQSNLVGGYV